MTVVNRLIAEADRGAKQLWINPADVGTLAEHARAAGFPGAVDDIRKTIAAGSMLLMGVPLRVRGRPAAFLDPAGFRTYPQPR